MSVATPDSQPRGENIPDFKYNPLNAEAEEIRLVRLLPGANDDEICVEIFHASFLEPDGGPPGVSTRFSLRELQRTIPNGWIVRETIEGRNLFISSGTGEVSWNHPDPNFEQKLYAGLPPNPWEDALPRYEALSYTWGPSTESQPINVLSGESSAQLPVSRYRLNVRPNLLKALQHLRYPDRVRTLWIDALSINQGELEEKVRQFKRMGSIYRRAHHVVIWIGPASSSSHLALNTLAGLGKQVEHAVDRWYPSPDATDPEWADPQFTLDYNEETWAALEDLLSRLYFKRVWVQQEARLPRHATICCGPDRMPWNLFRRAVITLREKQKLPKSIRGSIEDARELFNSRFHKDFFKLMSMSRKRDCTEQRDKVYGVLSLASPALVSKLDPQPDKTLVDVYQEAMIAHCEIGHRLDLLSQANYDSASWEGPSWIPDWSKDADNILERDFYAPGAAMSRAWYTTLASGILQAKGVYCGTIVQAEKTLQGENDRVYEIWRDANALGFKQSSKSPDRDLLDQFLHLALVGHVRDRYRTNLSYTVIMELREKYLRAMEQGDPSLNGLEEIRLERLRNLSFIVTSDGLLGLASTRVAPGDTVCVILGCHLPVILRPSVRGDGFHLMGPCLIDGMLDGETLLGAVPRPWKVEFYRDNLGYAALHFRNEDTKELTIEDPRLPSLPPDWERVNRDRSEDDPRWFACFSNKETGEIINSDPRLFPDALEQRGVEIETITLI